MEKILRGLLSKAYKLTDGEITALLENAETKESEVLTAVLAKDAERIASIKPKDGETFQDGYKKAKKEERTAFEKEIKEKYGVEADRTGLELIDAVLEAKTPAPKAGDITEDDVKKHPAYQNLERKAKADLKTLTDAHTKKVEELEKGFNRTRTLAVAKAKALDELAKLEPVLEENEQVATTRKKIFADALEAYDFDLQGDNLVVMKDGKVLDDGHGNTKAFSDLVKETAASHFVFKANNGGGNSNNHNAPDGSDNPGNKGAYPTTIAKKPTNIEELGKIVNDKTIPLADRQMASKIYQEEYSQK